MFLTVIAREIEDIVEKVPAFDGNGVQLKNFARNIAEAYLKRIGYADTLFARDIALGAVLLASAKLGPSISASELARAAHADLIAWPNVASDIRQQLRDLLAER